MYIDPGSSSFIIQMLIGGAAAGLLAIATFWRRIGAFLSKTFGKNKTETTSPSDPPSSGASG